MATGCFKGETYGIIYYPLNHKFNFVCAHHNKTIIHYGGEENKDNCLFEIIYIDSGNSSSNHRKEIKLLISLLNELESYDSKIKKYSYLYIDEPEILKCLKIGVNNLEEKLSKFINEISKNPSTSITIPI